MLTDQQNQCTKKHKRQANRAVRDAKEAPADGGAYKKESCSWSIRDWSFYDPTNRKARRK
jgi:hypothetical protein